MFKFPKKKKDEEQQQGHECEVTGAPRGHDAKFLISHFSLTLGMSNIWKMPYMVYKYGGGSFLYCYLLMVIFVGQHLFFLELACGQFTGLGPMTLPRCFPLARGLGMVMILTTLIITSFSNLILVYTAFYLIELLRPHKSHWECQESKATDVGNITCMPYLHHCPHTQNHSEWLRCINYSMSSLYDFWDHRVLGISAATWDFKLDLLLIHTVLWLVMFLICMRVVRCVKNYIPHAIGFPLCFLLFTNFKALCRHNASWGISNFFLPDWESFFTLRNWRMAAEYMLFSLNISLGANFMCGSSNHFDVSIHNDATMVTFIDTLFGILFSLLAFSIMGNMVETKETFYSTFRADESLIFIVFPQLFNDYFWMPYLMLACFLIAILYMCMDNMLLLVNTLKFVAGDLWPDTIHPHHSLLFLACFVSFLLGLPLVTRGGFSILHTLNKYGSGPTLLLNSFCEIAITMWGYGPQKMLKDFEFLLGSPVPMLTRVCLMSIAPVVLLLLLLDWAMDVRHELNQSPTMGHYALGVVMLGVGMALGPLVALSILLLERGPVCQPNASWRPEEDAVYSDYLARKTRQRRDLMSWKILKEPIHKDIN